MSIPSRDIQFDAQTRLFIIMPTLLSPSGVTNIEQIATQLTLLSEHCNIRLILVTLEIIDLSSQQRYSAELLQERANVEVIHTQGNIYAAMNAGLQAAQQNDLLFFCGDTDYPNLKALNDICRHPHDSNTLYLADVVQNKKRVKARLPRPNILAHCITERNPAHHQGIVYSAAIIYNLGKYESNYQILGDYDLNMKIVFKAKGSVRLVHLNQIFCWCDSAGTSGSARFINYLESFRIRAKYLPVQLAPVIFLIESLAYFYKNAHKILKSKRLLPSSSNKNISFQN